MHAKLSQLTCLYYICTLCSGDCVLVAVPGGDRRLSEIIKQGRTPLLTWTNNELVVEGYDLVKDDMAFGAVSHTWGDSIIAERAASTSLSNWARRLWTFPKAVLANRLYVAFERGLIDILELQNARDDARDNINSKYHHIWEVGHPFSSPVWELRKCLPHRMAKQSLRPAVQRPVDLRNKGISPIDPCPDYYRVARAWEAVKLRSVTASTDETIVLAQVLGVDMNKLAAIVNSDENKSKQNLAEKLMVALLEELDKTPGLGIPSGIIFLPGPYIRNVPGAKGFGWAPQTWLSHQANSDPLFRPLRQTAEILRRGLKVQFPGLVLHGFPTYPDKVFWVAVHQVIHKWFKVRLQIPETEDQAVDAADYWKGRLHPGQEIFIIMSTNNPRNRWETGVLVQSKEGGLLSRGSVRWVTRVCRVHVRLETSNVVIARETNKFRKSGEYTILGERLQKVTQCNLG
ncbi:hypothetical protein LTR15_003294 [Elasticomyces elasticus]|nr:hypothetical protein LTR15_003294 [Elasticomyces elasticus]